MTTGSPVIAGVRFSMVGKIYHFTAGNIPDLSVGDAVIVETSRGWQLGRVVQILPESATFAGLSSLKPIDRKATPRDLLMRQSWQQKEAGVVEACQTRVRELHLSGVKIIAAEYSFDGSKLTVMYSCETEDKVDLKSLRQDMQKLFSPVQLEMRQIGPRDVAKILGGMGACGLETRCCSRFLCDFNSISIRMAKEQGVSLTPSEITGMCGRLRCCLIYEYETYLELRKGFPKKKKRVITPAGEGKVVDTFPLRGCVMVEIPDVGRREFPLKEIIVPDEAGQSVEVSYSEEESVDGEELTFE